MPWCSSYCKYRINRNYRRPLTPQPDTYMGDAEVIFSLVLANQEWLILHIDALKVVSQQCLDSIHGCDFLIVADESTQTFA